MHNPYLAGMEARLAAVEKRLAELTARRSDDAYVDCEECGARTLDAEGLCDPCRAFIDGEHETGEP